MYGRDMAEDTKTGHDSAKKIVTVIKGELDSLMTGKGAASALAATRRLASREASGSGSGKRTADGNKELDVVEKKVKMDGEAPDSKGGAARNGSDGAVQAAKTTVARMSASHKADVVDAAAASYKFPVDEFTRALKAVEALGLKKSTRAQRVVLRGATMEQRAIAYLFAERIYAAKLQKAAAAKVYRNVARQLQLALKAAETFGPHGMAYVNSQAIKNGYQGPFKAKTIAAMGEAAAKARAASAAAVEPEKGKGKGQAVAAWEVAPGTVQRTGAEASMGMSKAAAASAAEESAGTGKAAAASVVESDDDDVDIVNVFSRTRPWLRIPLVRWGRQIQRRRWLRVSRKRRRGAGSV